MPRSTREWAVRKLRMAADGLDGPMSHLIEVQGPYKEPPQTEDMVSFVANCEEIATALLQMQQLLRGLSRSL